MITEFAFKLNGISLEHMLQLDEATINEAALNNYIYAYCQDDNTLAIGGAVNQKLPVIFRDGETIGIVLYRHDGSIMASPELLQSHNPDEATKDAYDIAVENGQLLLAENNPGDLPQAQWRIKSVFPVSEFDIFAGNRLFCRGIVFSADEVK